jgi:hypothetical protein
VSGKKRARGRKRTDAFARVGQLFLRVLQRDSTEAPAVVVSPGRGAQWVAAVFIGAPPTELRDQYLRGGQDGAIPARAVNTGDAHRVATGEDAATALANLEADLRASLAHRMTADLAVWKRAYGVGFRPPPGVTVEPMPADPGAPEPRTVSRLPERETYRAT